MVMALLFPDEPLKASLLFTAAYALGIVAALAMATQQVLLALADDDADAVVLGSPVNFSTVTALMKRFIERLIPYGYWPWGKALAPVNRIVKADKKAVIVTSSACPAFIGRILMPGALGALKKAAKVMGAKVIKSLYFGPVAGREDSQLSAKALRKARKAGEELVRQVLANR